MKFVSALSSFIGFGGETASAASEGFSILETVSAGVSLAGAAAQLFSSREQEQAIRANTAMQSEALELQARDQDLEAERERLRGKQEANQIMDTLRQTLAAQQVAFAANGIDLSFGTPVNVAQSSRNLAEQQLGVTRTDAQLRAVARRRQAASLRLEASNRRVAGAQEANITRQTGTIGALGAVQDLANRRIARG